MWGNMNKSSKYCAMSYMRKFVKGLSRFTLKRPNLSDNKTHYLFWKHYSIKIQAFEITLQRKTRNQADIESGT